MDGTNLKKMFVRSAFSLLTSSFDCCFPSPTILSLIAFCMFHTNGFILHNSNKTQSTSPVLKFMSCTIEISLFGNSVSRTSWNVSESHFGKFSLEISRRNFKAKKTKPKAQLLKTFEEFYNVFSAFLTESMFETFSFFNIQSIGSSDSNRAVSCSSSSTESPLRLFFDFFAVSLSFLGFINKFPSFQSCEPTKKVYDYQWSSSQRETQGKH